MKVLVSLPFLLLYALVAVGICWQKGWHRPGKALLAMTVCVLYLMGTPLASKVLMYLAKVPEPEVHPETLRDRGGQIIVVLGGGSYSSPETGAAEVAGYHSLERVRYAVRLVRISGLPVMFSGIESPALARTFREDYRLNAGRIEDRSRTTEENATMTAKALKGSGIQRIVLVTSAWHMERARMSFEGQGFTVLPAATGFPRVFSDKVGPGLFPRADLFVVNMFGLSELLGQVLYRFKSRSSPAPSPAPSAIPVS